MNATFEEILQKQGQLVYTNVGTSMLPLLRQHRDLLIIERKPEGRLHWLDVPLYRRDDGKYILHRILWVRKKDYIICGDNQWRPERGITDRHVIGVLRAVKRNGKVIEMNCTKMRLYAYAQFFLYPIRAVFVMARGLVRKYV